MLIWSWPSIGQVASSPLLWRQPLVCAISLHTNIFGQPHRLRVLREGLRRIRANPHFERDWVTRPGDIAALCEGLPAGVVP